MKPLFRSDVRSRVRQVIAALNGRDKAGAIDILQRLLADLDDRGVYDLQAFRYNEDPE